jgi:hypothetical protein
MSQITLRDLPEPVEREIRREARRRGSSLNKVIISLLQKGLGMSSELEKKRDLANLAGTWDKDALAEFQDATSIFETIDAENWQS